MIGGGELDPAGQHTRARGRADRVLGTLWDDREIPFEEIEAERRGTERDAAAFDEMEDGAAGFEGQRPGDDASWRL